MNKKNYTLYGNEKTIATIKKLMNKCRREGELTADVVLRLLADADTHQVTNEYPELQVIETIIDTSMARAKQAIMESVSAYAVKKNQLINSKLTIQIEQLQDSLAESNMSASEKEAIQIITNPADKQNQDH